MTPEEAITRIPAEYQWWVAFALLVIPYLTRAYYAVVRGGGIRGIYHSILFGTNTPAKDDEK